MSDLLRLERNSSYITIEGNSLVRSVEYTPRTPQLTVTEAVSELRSGGEVTNVSRRNLTESVEIVLQAATAGDLSDVQETINDIETWLRYAEDHQTQGVGDRVFVEYRPQDASDIWRSEILTGRVEIDEIYPRWLAQMHIRVVIYWTRRFYWEGSESELALTNGNGNGTGGRTVQNHDDGDAGDDNYVAIAGSAVEGVLPAPVRLEITNTYNDPGELAILWVGHNVNANPSSLDHILEGEDASGGTTQTVAGNSGGEYQTKTWATDTETELFAWTLGTSLLSACAGRRFHLLARFHSSPPTDVYFRWKIYASTAVIWTGPWFTFESGTFTQIRSMGVVQLPPWNIGGSGYSVSLGLRLFGRKTGGSTVNLDFVQLTPTDGFRQTRSRGGDWAAYTERLILDEMQGITYTDSGSGSARYANWATRGSPIMLAPGQDQRLYFLNYGSTGNADNIDRSLSIRAYYRPRRLTV
jgi:hypothetical protein